MPTLQLTPSSISFTYKKGEALPASYLINHVYGAPVSASAAPAWLHIYDFTNTTFKVGLNTGVNNITAGTINDTVKITSPGNLDGNEDLFWSVLNINLNLIDTLLLNVSPNSGNFNFTTGGTQPVSKPFSVITEKPWTASKNANWLNITNGSGSGNGSFSVAVVTAGLAPGVYNDTIVVDDGTTTKNIPITLTVSNPNTGTDFINVFPTIVNFGYTKTGIVPGPKNIDVNASANFTIVTTQPWLVLSSGTGVAGVSVISIGLQNVTGLSVGNHTGYVDFTVGGIVKRITVNLIVYQLITETLTPGQLYFADDENNIKISSGRKDTRIDMDVTTSFEGKPFHLTYNMPFSNGVAKKRLGEEAKNVIGNRELFALADAYVLTPYAPLSMNIDFKEVAKSTAEVVQSTTINNIKFVKGKKPSTNLMSNLPGTVFLTNKGMLIFSVLSNGQPSGNITIVGGIDKVIAGGVFGFPYYTVVLPISTLGGLHIGEEFTVSLLEQSINVVIIDDNLDHAILYSENQWGIFEPFELTGEVQEFRSYKDKAFTFRKNHLTTQTQVYEKQSPTTFKINTGYIHTVEMIDYLDKIMQATNYFLRTSTGMVQVRNTTRRLTMRKSLQENNFADLTFENVII